ncbi:hypothetical protein LJR009_002607 [Bosea sp. LjRoot9]|uniref:hypothetical protein n=1 Tax=Bosea sp. LjRoot9 TaxID=3342341 RepID=UPI003ECEB977
MSIWTLIRFGREARRMLRQIEAELESTFMQFVMMPDDKRFLVSTYMVQTIQKAIPDYDFRRQFYAQFVAHIIHLSDESIGVEVISYRQLRDRSKEQGDHEAEIAFNLLMLFYSLFLIRYRSQDFSRIFTERSRSMNDVIQNFLATKLDQVAGMRVDTASESFRFAANARANGTVVPTKGMP